MSASTSAPRHRGHAEPNLARSLEILAESITNGTHSNQAHNVCGVCGQWCPGNGGHYYITAAGLGLCPTCADKIGQGPIADRKARGIK